MFFKTKKIRKSFLLIVFILACAHNQGKLSNQNQDEIKRGNVEVLKTEYELDSASFALEIEYKLKKKYGLYKNDFFQKKLAESLNSSYDSIIFLNLNDIFYTYDFDLKKFILSKGTLENIEYENEMIFIACALMELKKIAKKNDNKNFEFNSKGRYAYSIDDYLEADKQALKCVKVLGFDPRGGYSFWKRVYLKQKKQLVWHIRPDFEERVDFLKVETAKLVPERSLIINSKDFKIPKKGNETNAISHKSTR
jgi:hypothetical protein